MYMIFAISGSVYVLCLNIALVLIFYYDEINHSRIAAATYCHGNRHVPPTCKSKRGYYINGLNVRERERERERE